MVQQEAGLRQGQQMADLLELFIGPLGGWLDARLDRRLVRTFFLALAAMVRLRHGRSGLLLSELGAHIISPDRAPAGTKRLSNLLRSPKRSHDLLEGLLWHRAELRLTQLGEQGETALAIWDESVLEKPESIALVGTVSRPFQQGRAPQAHQTGLLPSPRRSAGIRARYAMAHRHASWDVGSARSGRHGLVDQSRPLASHRREQGTQLLSQCANRWQQRVIHVFDRGYAGIPWLRELRGHRLRFIVRWPTRYHLIDDKGERPAWQITRGKRSQDYRQIWDCNRRQYRKTGAIGHGIRAVPVRHPQMDDDLWLVVSRPGKGRQPWYLLTNEPMHAIDDAWRVVLAYARRWQVEMCYRSGKTDLAMESPRLWFWENRLKLLLMASLVYAFILSLLTPPLAPLVQEILRHWCHRTGERHRQAAIPLSRLRSALSSLWIGPVHTM